MLKKKIRVKITLIDSRVKLKKKNISQKKSSQESKIKIKRIKSQTKTK
jgi:hypothetical protein